MSSSASARLEKITDEEIDMIEISEDYTQEVNALLVGDPTNGELFLTTHSCPYCHNEMQTIGIAHGIYECSKCAAIRSRRIVMDRTFKSLEN